MSTERCMFSLCVHSAELDGDVHGAYCKIYVDSHDKTNGTGINSDAAAASPDPYDARDNHGPHVVRSYHTHPQKGDRKTHQPVWNETFNVEVFDRRSEILSVRLKSKKLLHVSVVGACAIPLSQIPVGRPVDQWFPIMKGGKRRGKLRLQLMISYPPSGTPQRRSSATARTPPPPSMYQQQQQQYGQHLLDQQRRASAEQQQRRSVDQRRQSSERSRYSEQSTLSAASSYRRPSSTDRRDAQPSPSYDRAAFTQQQPTLATYGYQPEEEPTKRPSPQKVETYEIYRPASNARIDSESDDDDEALFPRVAELHRVESDLMGESSEDEDVVDKRVSAALSPVYMERVTEYSGSIEEQSPVQASDSLANVVDDEIVAEPLQLSPVGRRNSVEILRRTKVVAVADEATDFLRPTSPDSNTERVTVPEKVETALNPSAEDGRGNAIWNRYPSSSSSEGAPLQELDDVPSYPDRRSSASSYGVDDEDLAGRRTLPDYATEDDLSLEGIEVDAFVDDEEEAVDESSHPTNRDETGPSTESPAAILPTISPTSAAEGAPRHSVRSNELELHRESPTFRSSIRSSSASEVDIDETRDVVSTPKEIALQFVDAPSHKSPPSPPTNDTKARSVSSFDARKTSWVPEDQLEPGPRQAASPRTSWVSEEPSPARSVSSFDARKTSWVPEDQLEPGPRQAASPRTSWVSEEPSPARSVSSFDARKTSWVPEDQLEPGPRQAASPRTSWVSEEPSPARSVSSFDARKTSWVPEDQLEPGPRQAASPRTSWVSEEPSPARSVSSFDARKTSWVPEDQLEPGPRQAASPRTSWVSEEPSPARSVSSFDARKTSWVPEDQLEPGPRQAASPRTSWVSEEPSPARSVSSFDARKTSWVPEDQLEPGPRQAASPRTSWVSEEPSPARSVSSFDARKTSWVPEDQLEPGPRQAASPRTSWVSEEPSPARSVSSFDARKTSWVPEDQLEPGPRQAASPRTSWVSEEPSPARSVSSFDARKTSWVPEDQLEPRPRQAASPRTSWVSEEPSPARSVSSFDARKTSWVPEDQLEPGPRQAASPRTSWVSEEPSPARSVSSFDARKTSWVPEDQLEPRPRQAASPRTSWVSEEPSPARSVSSFDARKTSWVPEDQLEPGPRQAASPRTSWVSEEPSPARTVMGGGQANTVESVSSSSSISGADRHSFVSDSSEGEALVAVDEGSRSAVERALEIDGLEDTDARNSARQQPSSDPDRDSSSSEEMLADAGSIRDSIYRLSISEDRLSTRSSTRGSVVSPSPRVTDAMDLSPRSQPSISASDTASDQRRSSVDSRERARTMSSAKDSVSSEVESSGGVSRTSFLSEQVSYADSFDYHGRGSSFSAVSTASIDRDDVDRHAAAVAEAARYSSSSDEDFDRPGRQQHSDSIDTAGTPERRYSSASEEDTIDRNSVAVGYGYMGDLDVDVMPRYSSASSRDGAMHEEFEDDMDETSRSAVWSEGRSTNDDLMDAMRRVSYVSSLSDMYDASPRGSEAISEKLRSSSVSSEGVLHSAEDLKRFVSVANVLVEPYEEESERSSSSSGDDRDADVEKYVDEDDAEGVDIDQLLGHNQLASDASISRNPFVEVDGGSRKYSSSSDERKSADEDEDLGKSYLADAHLGGAPNPLVEVYDEQDMRSSTSSEQDHAWGGAINAAIDPAEEFVGHRSSLSSSSSDEGEVTEVIVAPVHTNDRSLHAPTSPVASGSTGSFVEPDTDSPRPLSDAKAVAHRDSRHRSSASRVDEYDLILAPDTYQHSNDESPRSSLSSDSVQEVDMIVTPVIRPDVVHVTQAQLATPFRRRSSSSRSIRSGRGSTPASSPKDVSEAPTTTRATAASSGSSSSGSSRPTILSSASSLAILELRTVAINHLPSSDSESDDEFDSDDDLDFD